MDDGDAVGLVHTIGEDQLVSGNREFIVHFIHDGGFRDAKLDELHAHWNVSCDGSIRHDRRGGRRRHRRGRGRRSEAVVTAGIALGKICRQGRLVADEGLGQHERCAVLQVDGNGGGGQGRRIHPGLMGRAIGIVPALAQALGVILRAGEAEGGIGFHGGQLGIHRGSAVRRAGDGIEGSFPGGFDGTVQGEIRLGLGQRPHRQYNHQQDRQVFQHASHRHASFGLSFTLHDSTISSTAQEMSGIVTT